MQLYLRAKILELAVGQGRPFLTLYKGEMSQILKAIFKKKKPITHFHVPAS